MGATTDYVIEQQEAQRARQKWLNHVENHFSDPALIQLSDDLLEEFKLNDVLFNEDYNAMRLADEEDRGKMFVELCRRDPDHFLDLDTAERVISACMGEESDNYIEEVFQNWKTYVENGGLHERDESDDDGSQYFL